MRISVSELNVETEAERGRKKETILAAINIVDGPSESLEFAVELAERWQANLCVMYVYSEVPRVSGVRLAHALASVDWERYRLAAELYRLVDRIKKRYAQTFAYFADNDCPAEAIQSIASKLNADLIIISTHDRGWLAKLLIYSDSDEIARRSSIPVLVYRRKSKRETIPSPLSPPEWNRG